MTLYIGLISGTSMDGVDAVLVDLSMNPIKVEAYVETPYPEEIRSSLAISLQRDQNLSLRQFKQLDVQVGRCFAEAANDLMRLARISSSEVRAIGSHGQTILHSPRTDPPFSVQIGDPATIAVRTRITTVADFRSLDIAAGGQGAPLVPAFHAALWRSRDEDRVIVNVGGIANVTILPADPRRKVIAFDTGPGNCLMDEWISLHRSAGFDRDGAWAASGKMDPELLNVMLSDPYFSFDPPKSTGRDYFNLDWLRGLTSTIRRPAEDFQATLAEVTAHAIASAINASVATPRVLVCGGGAYNGHLMHRLTELTAARVETTHGYGLLPDQVEACAFAWLAKLRLEHRHLPINITGAEAMMPLGAVYQPY